MPESKTKLIRVTTVPQSLKKLLQGQLAYMTKVFDVVAVSSPGAILDDVAIQEGVPVHGIHISRAIDIFNDLKALWKLYRYFSNEKPIIVHSHTPKAGLLSMIAARLARVPVRMHTVAGLPWTVATGFKLKVLKFTEKLTYRSATHVYCNSFVQRDYLIEKGITGGKKLEVIGNGSSNGINMKFFDPNIIGAKEKDLLKTKLHIKKEDFVFLFVGRLVKDKGLEETLKAFKRLAEENKNVRLLVLGDFEQNLNPIQSIYVDMLNSHEQIIFMGFQEDVRPYFTISDCFVFPSHREGFPNVVLQAGAMGLPAIVSDINGCNEIIKNDFNGIILPEINSDCVFNAMEDLIKSREKLTYLADNCRSNIVAKYDREIIWRLLADIYQNARKELNV